MIDIKLRLKHERALAGASRNIAPETVRTVASGKFEKLPIRHVACDSLHWIIFSITYRRVTDRQFLAIVSVMYIGLENISRRARNATLSRV